VHGCLFLTFKIPRAASDLLARRHQLLIGGQWVDARSGKTFGTFDPGSGRVIARVVEREAADIDAAVAVARAGFESAAWGRMTGSNRAKLMWRLADLIEQSRDQPAE
jgi:phenylacetaldehyde dehydrogenase